MQTKNIKVMIAAAYIVMVVVAGLVSWPDVPERLDRPHCPCIAAGRSHADLVARPNANHVRSIQQARR